MGQQVRCGRRRSHGAGALIAAVILVVAALIAAWTLLPRLFTPHETARTAEEAYCAAVSPDGARRTLTPDQAQNAALIANIAVTRGLPDHAATVAIATAMQESRLTNLDYGDLDSLGLFQQRPSQGWGTAEQVSDMTYATNIFYDHLLQVPDWETIPVEDAAQEVQRSGYPELYATWDAMARAWASGLTGERSGGRHVRVGASNLLGRGRVGCRHRRYTAECQCLGCAPKWQNRHEQRRCDQYGQHNVDDHAAGRPVRRQPHSTLLADGRLAGHACTSIRH